MMNGPDITPTANLRRGAEYDEDTGSCDMACHSNIAPFTVGTSAVFGVDYGAYGGCQSCHDASGPGPNVMGPGVSLGGTRATPKPFDDGAWGYNVNGHGGVGLVFARMNGNKDCWECHDLTLPAGAHRDTILSEVVGSNNQTTNTAHLKAAFIASSGGNSYDVQLQFDNTCAAVVLGCHGGFGPPDMRHSSSNPIPNVQTFGRGGTIADGELSAYPIDSDLTTNASTAAPDHAPCSACHDPHGTITIEPAKSTNRMLRDKWSTANDLCANCH
jgi:cytochrome c2